MRTKPIQRDEVRFRHRRGITTLPIDSVRKGQHGLEPIPKLWAPLLRTLSAEKGAPVEAPQLYWNGSVCTCRHCGGEFYRARWSSTYCSDKCAAAGHSAAVVKARSERRANERANRTCETCGEIITAKHSTMRFCSVRCRVAMHRLNAPRG
jgi:hypothetical protein